MSHSPHVGEVERARRDLWALISMPKPMYSGLYFSAKATAPALYACFTDSLMGQRSSPVPCVKNWEIAISSRLFEAASSATT